MAKRTRGKSKRPNPKKIHDGQTTKARYERQYRESLDPHIKANPRKIQVLFDHAFASRFARQFGQVLRQRRLELGWTIRQVSANGDIKSTGDLCDLENGTKDPLSCSVRTIFKIANAYNVKPSALFGRMTQLLANQSEDQ